MELLDSVGPLADGSTAMCAPPFLCSEDSSGRCERARALSTCPITHLCGLLVGAASQLRPAPCPRGLNVTLSAPAHSLAMASRKQRNRSRLHLIHASSGQFKSIHNCGRRELAPIPLKKLSSHSSQKTIFQAGQRASHCSFLLFLQILGPQEGMAVHSGEGEGGA